MRAVWEGKEGQGKDGRRVEASREREESGDEKDLSSSVGVWGGEGEGNQAAPGSGVGSSAALYFAGSLTHETCDVEAQGQDIAEVSGLGAVGQTIPGRAVEAKTLLDGIACFGVALAALT